MKKELGFTLIEIMISLVIGLIVVGGAISVYIITIKSSSDIVKSARLNYDVNSIVQVMANDIRRAGYWGGAIVREDVNALPNNPFTQATTDLQILDNGTCIVYSYDADGNGVNTLTDQTDDISANEYYGFKLIGKNILMRLSGTTNANCQDGSWQTVNLTDGNEDIEINSLSFVSNYKCLRRRTGVDDVTYNTSCAVVAGLVTGDRLIETREIQVTLEGVVRSDTTTTRKVLISATTQVAEPNRIKVRNDRIRTVI